MGKQGFELVPLLRLSPILPLLVEYLVESSTLSPEGAGGWLALL